MNSITKTRQPQFVTLYFQVHQPRRLGKFSFFDIGSGRDYFDDGTNQQIMQRVAASCYLPANFLLLELIRQYPQIKITFSISGAALRQFERFAPAVLESFRMLAATGSVEFLGETYYHSLAYLISPEEFREQVNMHTKKMHELLGVRPTVFRNTELIYSDDIGRTIGAIGFKGVFTDGIERVLNKRSPNYLYLHPDQDVKVLLRNYRLSDDIAFRFAKGKEPLRAKKYVMALEQISSHQNVINLGMDYETVGEHHKTTTGIFTFLEEMLSSLAQHKHLRMTTPSEAIAQLQPKDILNVPDYISWADYERDLSAWLGNDMQQDAFDTLSKMEARIKGTESITLLNTWRYLQTSDHFYYMSTKTGSDGEVHNYFSPYTSPYEAFMNYMNVLSDLSQQIEKTKDALIEKKKHFDFTLSGKLAKAERTWKPEALTF